MAMTREERIASQQKQLAGDTNATQQAQTARTVVPQPSTPNIATPKPTVSSDGSWIATKGTKTTPSTAQGVTTAVGSPTSTSLNVTADNIPATTAGKTASTSPWLTNGKVNEGYIPNYNDMYLINADASLTKEQKQDFFNAYSDANYGTDFKAAGKTKNEYELAKEQQDIWKEQKSELEKEIEYKTSEMNRQTAEGNAARNVALSGSREGITSASNVATMGTINDIVNKKNQQLQASWESTKRDLDRAIKSGNSKLAASLSQSLAATQSEWDKLAAQNKTDAKNWLNSLDTSQLSGVMDDADSMSYLSNAMGVPAPMVKAMLKGMQTKGATEATKAKLENQSKVLENLKAMTEQGVVPSDATLENIAKGTGIDTWTLKQYSTMASAIMAEKDIDEDKKLMELDKLNFELDRISRGITNAELEKVDYITQLYKKGVSADEIARAKRMMGVKDEDDPVYMAELRQQIAKATMAEYEAENQGQPPKPGTKEYLAYKKAELELESAKIERNEKLGLPADYGLAPIELSDKEYKDIFRPSGLSKYGHKLGNFECGEAYNKLTDGKKVGDLYSTKMAIVTKRGDPQEGNGLIIPLKGAGKYGHIETVIQSDGQNFTTVSFNRDGRGGQTIQRYTVDDLNKKYGNNWGFSDSKFKSNYSSALDKSTSAATAAPAAAKWAETYIDASYGKTEEGKAAKRKKEELNSAISEGRGADARQIMYDAIMNKIPSASQEKLIEAMNTKASYNSLSDTLAEFETQGNELGLKGAAINKIFDTLRVKKPDVADRLQMELSQAFNAYRVAVTGAGASAKELENLETGFPTIDKNMSRVKIMVDELKNTADTNLNNRIQQWTGKFKTYDEMEKALNDLENIGSVPETKKGNALSGFASSFLNKLGVSIGNPIDSYYSATGKYDILENIQTSVTVDY